jgi:AraC family transcriptional regulator of adaptative response/methylated-DNA-[protein]-cysteine methyltransferase
MQPNEDTGVMMAPPLAKNATDYDYVARAMGFLNQSWRSQPGLEEIAGHVGLSPAHFQRLFVRWAGISPKEFLRAVTLEEARRMLQDGASMLDASFDTGLSGPGRLHDLFVQYEAMTPGVYKARGEGLEAAYGFHPSPFGTAIVMVTDKGLMGLGFTEDDDRGEAALADLVRRWPKARYVEDSARTAPYAARIFSPDQWRSDQPLKLVLIGSDFDVMVWDALTAIPRGTAVTYGDLAARLGKPKAARAVGSAVGRNPISFAVPCHRVLRKTGALGGYHWGLARKRAILGWENAF